MAWIKVDQRLPEHPKVWKAARSLGCHPLRLVGHLVSLWTWALDYVPPDGSLDAVDALGLKRAAKWEGSATRFEKALTEAGLIDTGPRRLHDWREYAGPLLERREYDRDRQRRRRDKRATSVRQTCDNAATKPDGHVEAHADIPRKSQDRVRERVRGDLRGTSLHPDEDVPGTPQSRAQWEAELRRATTDPGRDQIVLESFHWQHGVLPLRKKRQGLLRYCRSYGHEHVQSVVFDAAGAYPDHPEAYVLKVLETPPTRRATDDEADAAMAALERMEQRR